LPVLYIDVSDSALAFSSSLCTFQGAIIQFGFLAALFWWVVIAFNMCVEVYFRSILSLEKTWWIWGRFIAYNIFVWGTAAVLMIIPAAAGEIKFLPGDTYCFVSTDDNFAWELTFWFIPVGLSLVIGFLLFVLALIKVTVLLFTIAKWKLLLFLYLRLSIFIFIYFVLFIFIIAYNIQVANNSNSIHTGYEQYYLCLLDGFPDCELDSSVSNYNLVMLRGFSISALGIMLFLIFIASKEAYDFYGDLAKNICIALFVKKDPFLALYAFKQVISTQSTGSKISSISLSEVATREVDLADENLEKRDEEESNKSEEEDDTSSSSSPKDE